MSLVFLLIERKIESRAHVSSNSSTTCANVYRLNVQYLARAGTPSAVFLTLRECQWGLILYCDADWGFPTNHGFKSLLFKLPTGAVFAPQACCNIDAAIRRHPCRSLPIGTCTDDHLDCVFGYRRAVSVQL